MFSYVLVMLLLAHTCQARYTIAISLGPNLRIFNKNSGSLLEKFSAQSKKHNGGGMRDPLL
jgi:hypothetical protein